MACEQGIDSSGRGSDVAAERGRQPVPRVLPGPQRPDQEARQSVDAPGEPGHETSGDERRLAGSRRSDDIDLALAAAQPADDAIELDVATEEPASITLGERPHAGVRARQV